MPLKKTLSQRRAKQMLKPWITRGLRKSIKVKNLLYYSGNNSFSPEQETLVS